MIALIDCNNFFVSCERAFNPKLMNKPVVVISNNEGCVIARSNEAKKLLIPMGAPYFKVRHIIEKHHVQVLSTNFDLYTDLSSRIMRMIHEAFPLVEVYSVDEAFIDLKGMNDVFYYICKLQQNILKGIGIPTTVGIAATKTLTKIANDYAKKRGLPLFKIDASNKDDILKNTTIGDVWGIGKKNTLKMQTLGIYDAYTLMQSNSSKIRKTCSVVEERIIFELNENRCFDINDVDDGQKSIQVSRSFAHPITNINDITESISTFVERLCKKLRSQNTKAKSVMFYIKSSPFSKPAYFDTATITFTMPIDDPITMMQQITPRLKKLFKENVLYKKAGVQAIDLYQNSKPEKTLFKTFFTNHATLFKSIDLINKRFGTKTIQLLSSGIHPTFEFTNEKRSPQYTTHWDDLLKVG